jgi:hypothetical protein
MKKNMFSDPSFDLSVSLILFSLAFLVAGIIWAITKKRFLALLVFSLLGNLSFLVNIGSMMFDFYSIKWVGYFSLLVWPVLNIYLLINYFSNKNKNENKKT